MAPTAGVTHDITIAETNGSTNKRGFMLARDRDLRQFSVDDSEAVPPRVMASGDFTEAESPPHIRAFWSQSNWEGFGGVVDRTGSGVDAPHRFALLNKAKTDPDGRLRPWAGRTTGTFDVAPTETGTNGFAIVDTELWAFVGRDVYVWDDTNSQWDKGTVPRAATRIYRNAVPGPSSYVVAPSWDPANSSNDNRYIYKRDSDADWTAIGAGTGSSPRYLATGRNANGNDILWAGHIDGNVADIRSTTDPTALANWSGATVVGSANSAITALLDYSNTLLICKQDGIWALAPGGVPTNLTPDFAFARHPDHFLGSIIWNGRAILPLGTGGMLELRGATLRDISLRNYLPEQTAYHGVVTALAASPTRLFVMVRNTADTTYRVLAGQLIADDYVWYHLTNITYSGVPTNAQYHTAMMVVSQTYSGTNRQWLLIGIEDTGGDAPYRMPIEPQHADWTYTNEANVEATTEVFDAGFPHLSKTFATLDGEFSNLGAGGRTITVEYRTTRGGSWTTLGTFNDTSGRQTLTFTAGTTGITIEFRFTLAQTNDTTTAPELVRFRLAYSLRNTQIETIPLTLYLADGQVILNGSTESRVAGALAQLRTWDTQAAEVTVVDAEGTSRDMVFLPGTLKVQEAARELGHRSEWIVRAQLVEV